MKQLQKNYKRIVIKIGSSLFYARKSSFEDERLTNIISEISTLIRNDGIEIVIVSSGAIALGMEILSLKARPKSLPLLQAAAAIGQNALMDKYARFFKQDGINCAQVLLTWDDFDTRKRYLNARNTLEMLLKIKSVPVINENDTISTEEIKFGDNDQLSARVASLISADLLIILSDVDGLLDRDGHLVSLVDKITPELRALACTTSKKACVGGMITKIEAAKIAVDSGIPCVIANGAKALVISGIIGKSGKSGTLFLPKESSLVARKRWIAFGAKPKGKIIVDNGASSALLKRKSLLAVGVVAVQGAFSCMDTAVVTDISGMQIAIGKVSMSSKELDKVKGKRIDKEVIHSNDIALLHDR